ncbi:MAG: serine hydrolase domain-containing protein [Polyangiales bacterium]
MLRSKLEDLKPVLVDVHEPESVTTRSYREVDPRSVGLSPADVEAIWSTVVAYYRLGLHPALALCVRRRGEIVLDRAIGHARGNSPQDPVGTPLVKATPNTLFNFFSGSKSITAMLVHLLHERGAINLDEPVATYVPEFAKNRKHRITIADVLTHRSGIPSAPSEALDLDLLKQPDEILRLVCDLRPTFKPGRVPAYHAITGGFILQEVIERVTGQDLRTILRKAFREPMGMENFDYGVPEEKLDRVAMDAFTGPIPTWPHKNLIQNALGLSMRELVDVANDPRFRTGVVPSGNIIATPEEIGRFFEMLLCGGVYDGKRVLKQQTIARAVKPETQGQVDRMLMLPVPYSMGFMLGSDVFGFYGARCGKAYGHLGFTNVLGWADPERDISVAFMNTGKPLLSAKFIAWFNVMRTISTKIPRDRPGG